MKKKILFFATLMVAMLSLNCLSAQNYVRNLDANDNGVYEEGEVDACQEYVCGPARCTYPVTRFKKCSYCTKRCVCDPYCVKKKCCRYVNQYYTKQHCRYVPQYYTKTYCRKVPQYYCVEQTRYRKRYITDTHCYYKPYRYCKTTCCDMNPCPGGECAE